MAIMLKPAEPKNGKIVIGVIVIRVGHAPIFADAHRCASDAHQCA